MTNEHAKKMLKAKLECLKRETSGTDIDCNCRNCDECNLCYEQGNMGEQKEYLRMSIEALEQEPILDKIRAEIELCREDAEPHLCDYRHHRNEGLEMALDIIDKYKTESEG